MSVWVAHPASLNRCDTRSKLLAQLEHHSKLQDAISQAIETHSVPVRYKLNTLVPLHMLPAELFREILVQALLVDSNGSLDTWKHVHKLASVSKFWYEMVTGEPRLWTKITSIDPPMVTATKLRNSKGAELDVELDLAGRMPRITADAEEDWLANAVSGESRRWKTLAFRCTTCPRWIYQALDGAAPALRDLCVRIPRGWQEGMEGRINLGDGGEPLRRLRLESIGMTWDSLRLVNLKYLWLANILTHHPTLSQLRAIIQSSPTLETLGLINTPCQADEVDYAPIHLPHLRTFKLEGVPQAVSTNLVSSIHAAQGCSILVRHLDAADLAASSVWSALVRWVGAPFQATGCIFLSVDGHMDEVTIRTSPSPHVEVWSPETWPDQGAAGAFLVIKLTESSTPIRQIVEILKASNSVAVIHLDIRWFGVEDQRKFPVEILDLKGVQQMTVLAPFDAKTVMEYLKEPKLSPQGDWRWACPNLATLRVGSADPHEITKLLHSRRGYYCKQNRVLPREMLVDCLLGYPAA
ncbi:hypothetical protein FRC05_008651 [Tulasnella sp. 425]|nr:hypothetical protein FRC05_008651 [Tulasnella sp. 425]